VSFTLHYRPQHAARINEHLQAISGPGAQRFGQAVSKALTEGNRDDRLRGVDRRGRTLKELKWPRKGKYAGATGPPLAPFGEASRSIALYFARVTRRAAGWTLTAGFSGPGAEILGHHAAGAPPNPVRDVFGVTPRTWAVVLGLFKDFAAGVFRARGYRG
jgi:hypothetical protein